jgi:MoxR-like ATPase
VATRSAEEAPTLVLERAVRTVGRVVRGKDDVVRLTLVGLLARGHVLLEDVPGVGKTTLAQALARILGGTFSRVQLTSDLLPADLLGGQVLDRARQELAFRAGPIFANVVLADELNRATPRTQSGLLEAMAERSVSIDGITHALPDPFFVIATQNPIEHHGVYHLPQSQMDRFLLRTHLGYPDEATELELLRAVGPTETDEAMEPALSGAVLDELMTAVDGVELSPDVARYLRAIIVATRSSGEIEMGVSTRGLLAYGRAARAKALVEGRRFVTPDDVLDLAVPVCAHRVALTGERATRAEAEAVVLELAEAVEPPL